MNDNQTNMMMRLSVFFCAVLFIQACASTEESKQLDNSPEPAATEQSASAEMGEHDVATEIEPSQIAVEQMSEESTEQALAPAEKIELNEGKKWQAGAEMIAHVEVMQIVLNDFSPEGLGDYHATAKVLDAELGALVSSCKMKGAGHDELHKWLLPVMQRVEAMSKVGNETRAVALTTELKQMLADFHNYFEKSTT